MRFVYPQFLFALFAVAIPILIHLFNFRRFKKVYFSNVTFLKDIEVQTSSSKNLRRLLVLLARILAIIFLVLAFARPYVPVNEASGNIGKQAVSVFIDNSFSMETVNRDGSLLDEAKRRARELASAYSLNDKFQLLTNDFEGKHQRLLNYEDFLTAVDEVSISNNSRTLPQILNRQRDVLSAETNSRKTAYLISDFQKNMLDTEALSRDSSIALRLIRLQATGLPNVSVDSVWFQSPIHKPGDTEKLIVQLRNNSDERAENVPVKLLINTQQKAIASISIAPRSVKADTLSFSGLKPGWQQGELRITDYPVIFDDNFFFSFHVKDRLPILAINEKLPSSYLQAVYRSDPFFSLSNSEAGNINYAALSTYPLIILNELNSISTGLAQQLNTYVKRGGNLMVFPSLDGNLDELSALLESLGTDVPEQVSEQPVTASNMNARHPLFNGVFERVPQRLDLPVARKYLVYSNRSRTTRDPVLDLPGNRLFFGQYRFGSGSVYLCAVPLSEESGNFVRHSVFVPIMFQAALLSLRDSRLFYTIGKDDFLEMPKIAIGRNQVLKLRRGRFDVIPDVRQTGNATRLFVADQIKESGNYELLKDSGPIGLFAFNDNRSESDLSYVDNSVLKNTFGNQKVDIFEPGNGSVKNEIRAVNEGTQLWKICLMLALLFIAAEIALLRFYRTRTQVKFESK